MRNILIAIVLIIITTQVSSTSIPVPVKKIGEYIKGETVGYHGTMPIVRTGSKLVVCSDNSLSKIVYEIEVNSKFTSIYGGLGNDYLFIVTEQDDDYSVSKYIFLEKEKTFRYIESFATRYPKLIYAYYNSSNTSDNGKLQGILFTDNQSLLLCDGKGVEIKSIKFKEYSNVGTATRFGEELFCYSKESIIIYKIENNAINKIMEYNLPVKGNPDQIRYANDNSFIYSYRTRLIIDGRNLYQISFRQDRFIVAHAKLDCECELVGDILLSCDDGLYVKLLNHNIDAKLSDDALSPLAFTISLNSINDYYLFEKKENNKSKLIVLRIHLDDSQISFFETEWLEINVVKSTYCEDEFDINNKSSGHRLFCIFDDKYRYTIDLTNIIFDKIPLRSQRVRFHGK